jgi:MFS family permease
MATTPVIFTLGRVLQGIGAAAPLLISRTLLVATLSGSQLKMAMAQLALVSSGVAILAPLIGGTFAYIANWQFIAWLLAGYFSITALVGWWILPTEPYTSAIHSVRPKFLLKQYGQLLREGQFIAIAAYKWLPTFIYLTIQLYFPFLLQQHFQLSEKQFGIVMTLPMSGLLMGASISKYLQKMMSELALFAIFWPLLIISALCYSLLPFSLATALFGYGLVMIVFGGCFAAYMQLLGTHYAAKTGSANALVGAVELLVFTLLALGCNAYVIQSFNDLAWIILSAAGLLLVAWFKLFHSQACFKGIVQYEVRQVLRNR